MSNNVIAISTDKKMIEDHKLSVLKEVQELVEQGKVSNLVIAYDTDEVCKTEFVPEDIYTFSYLINLIRMEYDNILWATAHPECFEED